jgi:hypothetical protein
MADSPTVPLIVNLFNRVDSIAELTAGAMDSASAV